MKSEMDMTADRVAELTIELSKKSQEAKRFEVMVILGIKGSLLALYTADGEKVCWLSIDTE